MEIFVLSDRRLTSMAEWQRSLDTARLGITMSTDVLLDKLSGFLPVGSGKIKTGFECDYCPALEVIKLYGRVDFGRTWLFALAFNWQGIDECFAAYAAASAYALAVDGVVFDPQDGIVMPPQQALEVTAKIKADLSGTKQTLRALASVKASPGNRTKV
jgi:hypothetical protein